MLLTEVTSIAFIFLKLSIGELWKCGPKHLTWHYCVLVKNTGTWTPRQPCYDYGCRPGSRIFHKYSIYLWSH
jgi:hypothetical protein